MTLGSVVTPEPQPLRLLRK